jgi:hypothetical protein
VWWKSRGKIACVFVLFCFQIPNRFGIYEVEFVRLALTQGNMWFRKRKNKKMRLGM